VELLTVYEAADILRVNPMTVRRYITDGRLTAVRVGKGVRVRKESLEGMLTPVEPRRRPRPSRLPTGRPFTLDDPLWNIVGAGESRVPAEVSTKKREYLAEAYATKQ
jgi:excisionase family DNA binding protein